MSICRRFAPSTRAVVFSLFLFTLVSVGVFGFGQNAYADPASSTVVQKIVEGFGGLVEFILQLVGKLLTLILYVMMAVAQYNDFIYSTAVSKGWSVVRDICNMFFVLVLLAIAAGTILQQEKYHYSKTLPKFILMAILINFSKTICGLLIDFAQVVMMTFVGAFSAAGPGNFIGMLGVQNLLRMTANGEGDWQGNFISLMLALIYAFIALVVVAVITLQFIIRIVALWFLVTLSPLAFFLSTLPQGEKYAAKWWEQFTNYVILGPVLAFFLWISLAVTQNAADGKKDAAEIQIHRELGNKGADGKESYWPDANKDAKAKGLSVGNSIAGTVPGVAGFMLGIVMLLASLVAAQQLASVGGGIATNALSGMRKVGEGAARLPVQLGGRAAAGAARAGAGAAKKAGAGALELAKSIPGMVGMGKGRATGARVPFARGGATAGTMEVKGGKAGGTVSKIGTILGKTIARGGAATGESIVQGGAAASTGIMRAGMATGPAAVVTAPVAALAAGAVRTASAIGGGAVKAGSALAGGAIRTAAMLTKTDYGALKKDIGGKATTGAGKVTTKLQENITAAKGHVTAAAGAVRGVAGMETSDAFRAVGGAMKRGGQATGRGAMQFFKKDYEKTKGHVTAAAGTIGSAAGKTLEKIGDINQATDIKFVANKAGKAIQGSKTFQAGKEIWDQTEGIGGHTKQSGGKSPSPADLPKLAPTPVSPSVSKPEEKGVAVVQPQGIQKADERAQTAPVAKTEEQKVEEKKLQRIRGAIGLVERGASENERNAAKEGFRRLTGEEYSEAAAAKYKEGAQKKEEQGRELKPGQAVAIPEKTGGPQRVDFKEQFEQAQAKKEREEKEVVGARVMGTGAAGAGQGAARMNVGELQVGKITTGALEVGSVKAGLEGVGGGVASKPEIKEAPREGQQLPPTTVRVEDVEKKEKEQEKIAGSEARGQIASVDMPVAAIPEKTGGATKKDEAPLKEIEDLEGQMKEREAERMPQRQAQSAQAEKEGRIQELKSHMADLDTKYESAVAIENPEERARATRLVDASRSRTARELESLYPRPSGRAGGGASGGSTASIGSSSGSAGGASGTSTRGSSGASQAPVNSGESSQQQNQIDKRLSALHQQEKTILGDTTISDAEKLKRLKTVSQAQDEQFTKRSQSKRT